MTAVTENYISTQSYKQMKAVIFHFCEKRTGQLERSRLHSETTHCSKQERVFSVCIRHSRTHRFFELLIAIRLQISYKST